jgi:hypothetical protein
MLLVFGALAASRVTKKTARQMQSRFLTKIANIGVPLPFEPPFDVLLPPVNALLCAEAGYEFASVHTPSMRGRCNRMHGWRSTVRGKHALDGRQGANVLHVGRAAAILRRANAKRKGEEGGNPRAKLDTLLNE